ncbi:MAG: hypothetical protein P794_03935 [Epsilonproteobacteria bacterium (ex Lamellibrachia satsuma)]|nr:MAG: hypothetical protein P794_03935 [Epsilonproteobacteria bacterium (ex Lamellibrachia satsuma)]
MAIDPNDYPNKVKQGLKADRDFKKFYYRFSYQGKSYKGIIDTADKPAWGKRDRIRFAETELERIRKAKREGVLSDKITMDKFMESHFARLPDTTWTKAKKSHYERYISPSIGKKPVVSLRQLHIKDNIAHQEKLGLSARTVKQTIEILNPAFKEAIANRLIVHNPMDGVRIKREKTKKIVSNASEELVRIYTAIEEEFGEDPFYYSLYMFALQGRRKSEILNLKWTDIGENYYILRDTKSGEEQKIFLPDAIKEKLEIFKMDTEYVFTSRRTGTRLVNIEKTTKKLKDKLGVEFSLHYLRNVIVSAMAESGLEAIYLSGALGHSDPNTITKYLTMNYMKGSKMASGLIDQVIKK